MNNMKTIEVIAVAYDNPEQVACFVYMMKSQTASNWKLRIIHDGGGEKYDNVLSVVNNIKDDRVFISSTDKWNGNAGHVSRDYALKNPIFDSYYTIITNTDNYYVPTWISEINKREEDFVYWDCVHNHVNPNFDRQVPYGLLNAKVKYMCIDMGCAAIKTEIARKIGFNSRRYMPADWDYFEECLPSCQNKYKIPQILFIHN